jgi:hypothetical protein
VEPGVWDETAARNRLEFEITVLSTLVMTSPAVIPAAAAGPPRNTPAISAPGPAVGLTETPRKPG